MRANGARDHVVGGAVLYLGSGGSAPPRLSIQEDVRQRDDAEQDPDVVLAFRADRGRDLLSHLAAVLGELLLGAQLHPDFRPRVVRLYRRPSKHDVLGPSAKRLGDAPLDGGSKPGVEGLGPVKLGEDHGPQYSNAVILSLSKDPWFDRLTTSGPLPDYPSRRAAATRNGSLETTLDA